MSVELRQVFEFMIELDKLKAVLGKAKVTMFEMTKLISSHLK